MMHYPLSTAGRRAEFRHRLPIGVAALLSFLLLAGCATTGTHSGSYDYEYETANRFVRLEPKEANAPDNDHPASISTDALIAALSTLQASGNVVLTGDIEAFTADELAEVAGHIASALARARPDQDVSFQSAGSRGLFKKYSPPSFTSGRVFVQAGELNVILGVLHSTPDPNDTEADSKRYRTGSRSERVERGWTLAQGAGRLVEDRGDWVRFELTGDDSALTTAPVRPAIPDSSAARDKPPGSTVEQDSRSIESRLRVLDDLKAKKLITDEEYQAKRQAILDGI